MAILGIDLGTTFSAAAYEDENGRVIIVDIDGSTTVPSVVYIDGDEITVGDQAMHRWLVEKEKVCRWVKRAMGDPLWIFPRRLLFSLSSSPEIDVESEDVPDDIKEQLVTGLASNGVTLSDAVVMKAAFDRWNIRDGDTAFVARQNGDKVDIYEGMTAVDISAEILKVMKANAEERLGMPVDEAVITCPAYFNSTEVLNTRRAGELAGFDVKEVVKEPVAAAVYHGIERMKEGEQIMICDLGGGTFDSTILRIDDGKFQSVATIGDRVLGGHDWTEDLQDLVREKFMDLHQLDPTNDPLGEQRLYEECEEAKRTFGQLEEVDIACSCDDVTDQITVTRQEFEDQTDFRMDSVLDTCRKCLGKAGVKWSDLDGVLLVGGSSRLRRLSEVLRKESGLDPQLSKSPDEMVVSGAAIIAHRGLLSHDEVGHLSADTDGGLEPVFVGQTSERALATRVYSPDKGNIVSVVIMPHGQQLPASRSCDAFAVSVDGQEFFDIPIMEFEDYQVEDEEAKNETVANFRFYCSANAKAGDRVKVTLGYTKEAGVYAEAEDLKTNRTLRVEERPYEEPDLTACKVTIKPHWMVFALDVSYSMESDGKIVAAKKALRDKAGEILSDGNGKCKVGLVTFSERAQRVCDPTDDIALIASKIDGIHTVSTTAMDEGIQMAEDLVMTAPAGTERFVILVTDGYADDDSSARQAANHARSRGVTLVSLGIGLGDVDEDFLRDVTDAYDIIDVSSAQDLSDGLGHVLSQVTASGSAGGLEASAAGGLTEESKWK